jgi:hypothetical protein
MNREHFSRSDLRLTIAAVLVSAVCLVYIRLEYDKAFPQASIKLVLSKTAITDLARKYLEQRGLKTAGFRELTIFDPDDDARLYLERELGLERANQLMQRDIAVWRWRARWFHPPEQEEMAVWESPDGRLTGFSHVIPEAAAGSRLSHEEALKLAQDFVHRRSPAPMHIVEDRLERRPNRNDYLFTWEQDGFKAKDATYRRTVVVQGGAVGRYQEFLYIPENWRREFAAMRSKNDLYATIAEAFWLPLVLAALFLLVRGLRRHEIPWRPLLLISGVVGALMIVSQLNSIPLLVDRFPTSSPYLETLLLIVLGALGAGMGVFFYVIIAGAAGEPGYRRWTGDPISLRTAFTAQGLATRQFYRAVVVGYGFAAVHVAFLVAFYLIGRRFGVWSPQDVQYSDLLSTALPWIYPVAIAAMAASSEEFWFRLLAIPLLARLLRVRWLAVVIPAFIWGFLHANYPQQPAWIRGVEVGSIGIVAGFLMLRFGIVATLTWHYTVDALLIGGYLFDAPSLFYRINFAILGLAVLAPLIVSVVLYRRNRGFVEIAEPAPVEEAPAAVAEPERAEPVRPRWDVRWLYAAAALAGLGGIFLGPHVFGGWIRIRLDRTAAEAIARRNVPDPGGWRTTTQFIPNLDVAEFEYLRRNAGTGAADRIVEERKPTAVWLTRFFRPLEKQEWRVYVDQSGNMVRRDHILDERAPGDRLSADEARLRAVAALPISGMTLVDSSEERRENRTDWSFVFEDPRFRAGDARARMSVELHGGEISNFRRFLKLPEDWLREFQKPTLRNFVMPALLGTCALPLLLIFIRRLGAHETRFHWPAYALTGGAALLAAVISTLNQLPGAMMGYDTAAPEQNYVLQYSIGRMVFVILAAVGIFGLALAVDVFRQAAVGSAALNRPSVVRAAAIALLLAGIVHVVPWAVGRIPGPRASVPVWGINGLDTYLPGAQQVAQGYLSAAVWLSAGAILAFATVRYMRPRRRWIAGGITVIAFGLSRSLTVPEFAANAAAAMVLIATIVLIVETCAADLVSAGVALFWVSALGTSYELIKQPDSWVRTNGIAAGIATLLIGAMVVTRSRSVYGPARQRPKPPAD